MQLTEREVGRHSDHAPDRGFDFAQCDAKFEGISEERESSFHGGNDSRIADDVNRGSRHAASGASWCGGSYPAG